MMQLIKDNSKVYNFNTNKNYIIEETDGIFSRKSSWIDEETCAYLAKQRTDNGKDWANSPVSKQAACRHCRGTGVLSFQGTQRSYEVLGSEIVRGEPRHQWKQACICIIRKIEKDPSILSVGNILNV